MSSIPKVVVLVGSLRKESLNRRLAAALPALNAAPLEFEIAEIGTLALYNQDLDGDSVRQRGQRFESESGPLTVCSS